MAKIKTAKPPMDPNELLIETTDVTQEQFSKGVPINRDGSVKTDGELPVEQAESIGAVDADSAQRNKTQAKILHKKNSGEAKISWNTRDALEIYDNIKQVGAWSIGNISIYITLTKEMRPNDGGEADPNNLLFNFQPVPMKMFRDAGELYSYVQKSVHRDSPNDAVYYLVFKEGGRQIRGTGYINLRGVQKPEVATQQPGWSPQNPWQGLQQPWQSHQPPGYGGPPGFGAPPAPYGMNGAGGYGAPQLPSYNPYVQHYAQPEHFQQPLPPQPMPPSPQAPAPQAPQQQPMPPQNYPPPYQPQPGPDPTTMQALSANYSEQQRIGYQMETLTRQLAASEARNQQLNEWMMSGRMGAPPQAQVAQAPVAAPAAYVPPPQPAGPPEPPPVLAFSIPCMRCGQLAAPNETDVFAKDGRMLGRTHKTCPQVMGAQPQVAAVAPQQQQQQQQPPQQQMPSQQPYGQPQYGPPQYGNPVMQPQAAAPVDPMRGYMESIKAAGQVFTGAVEAVSSMQDTMQRILPQQPHPSAHETIETTGQSMEESPWGTIPVLNGEGQLMYDKESKKLLPWGIQALNNVGAITELTKALGGVVKDAMETVRMATAPKPNPNGAITTQGYATAGMGLPAAPQQQQQPQPQQQSVQQPAQRQAPPPAVFQPPNFGGFTG